MADGRDLLLGPGGLAGFTVHLEAEPNPGTRRLMDWLGVEIDVTATAAGMAICLVGGCGWHWDGQGERHEAIEAHRAAEHDYIPAHRFSVRSHLNGAEGYDIDLGPVEPLPVLPPEMREPEPESKEEVETMSAAARWDRESIIETIRTWALEHGKPPSSREWDQASDDHPAKSTVAKHCGSWADAVVAAGFDRPTRGGAHRSSVREPKAREAAVLSGPSPADVKQPDRTGDVAVSAESPCPPDRGEAGSRTDEHGDQADGHHEWLLSLGLNAELLGEEIARLDELSVLCATRRDALQRFLDELAAA